MAVLIVRIVRVVTLGLFVVGNGARGGDHGDMMGGHVVMLWVWTRICRGVLFFIRWRFRNNDSVARFW